MKNYFLMTFLACTHLGYARQVNYEYCDPIIEYDYPLEYSYEMQENENCYETDEPSFWQEGPPEEINTAEEEKDGSEDSEKKEEPPRRALPAPFASPPFPSAEYQGYPLIGVPPEDTDQYPLMKWLSHTCFGEALKKAKISLYGWINASANLSTCRTFKYARFLLDCSQQGGAGSICVSCRTAVGFRTNRSCRCRIPLNLFVWHRLSLYDSRRLDQLSTA